MEEDLEDWVVRQMIRHEKWIQDIADMEWPGYVERREELTAHMAKMQVLTQVKKKLKETK